MMKVGDWLEFFKKHKDMKVFHFNHLKLFSRMESHSLRVALKRLTDRKLITRVCRGYYANPFSLPTIEEVSAQIYKPSYVSLESVLSKSGILSQMPQVLTCVTTKLPRSFDTPFGSISYRQIKKACFWGFHEERSCLIAEPEKALLDFLYFKKRHDIKMAILGFNLDDIDSEKLRSYANKMGLKPPYLPA